MEREKKPENVLRRAAELTLVNSIYAPPVLTAARLQLACIEVSVPLLDGFGSHAGKTEQQLNRLTN